MEILYSKAIDKGVAITTLVNRPQNSWKSSHKSQDNSPNMCFKIELTQSSQRMSLLPTIDALRSNNAPVSILHLELLLGRRIQLSLMNAVGIW